MLLQLSGEETMVDTTMETDNKVTHKKIPRKLIITSYSLFQHLQISSRHKSIYGGIIITR
jgi:hypothetical protein